MNEWMNEWAIPVMHNYYCCSCNSTVCEGFNYWQYNTILHLYGIKDSFSNVHLMTFSFSTSNIISISTCGHGICMIIHKF